MDETRRIVTENNVERFVDLLTAEADLKQRNVLHGLLSAEIDRFDDIADRRVVVEKWRNCCDTRIVKVQELLAQQVAKHRPPERLQSVLRNLLDLKNSLTRYRDTISVSRDP